MGPSSISSPLLLGHSDYITCKWICISTDSSLHIFQTLKMEATRSCETLMSTEKARRCHNPGDHNLIERLVVSNFGTEFLLEFYVFWYIIIYSIDRGKEGTSSTVSDVDSYVIVRIWMIISIYYGNEGASFSVSDVNGYVSNIKFQHNSVFLFRWEF
jgi:hypothetical protein